MWLSNAFIGLIKTLVDGFVNLLEKIGIAMAGILLGLISI
jgi:hypothetical protein